MPHALTSPTFEPSCGKLPLNKILDEDESVSEEEAGLVSAHLAWAAHNNMSVVLHLSHFMPRWATELHSDLVVDEEEAQHGVHYDIDHPFALGVLRKSLRGLVARLGCHRNLVGIEIANEPAFRVTTSRHAKKSFEAWLKAAYHEE